MTTQLFGSLVNLVGNGGFRAWTFGDWFLMKYGNIVMVVLVAGLFLVGLVVNLPEHTASSASSASSGSSGSSGSKAAHPGAESVESIKNVEEH
ncbi:MAG: hypothetical protein ACYDGN_02735 [Acidimicrobiales bacterium]